MVAGDIALNAENPQIRSVERGSTSMNIISNIIDRMRLNLKL
jgi:hypothetical protein